MPPRNWEKIKAILEAAATVAPDQQDLFLETQCGQDLHLQHEVRSLLAFENDPAIPADLKPSPEITPHLPQVIEGYRIQRRLGTGGASSVFFAIRESDRQPAAIKLSRLPFGTVLQKLDETLGGFHHPNIPKLIKSGTIDRLWQFEIREYVDGIPAHLLICDHRIPPRQLLRLFTKVCAIVACLHQYGVVHADLKPSNILVNPDGEPHLIDFGNAVHASGQDSNPSNTLFRQFTPFYVSPEQLAGHQLRPASDVFSLGRWLSELAGSLEPEPTLRLTPVIRKALGGHEAHRHSTAQELADHVNYQLARQPIARPDGTYPGHMTLKSALFPTATTAILQSTNSPLPLPAAPPHSELPRTPSKMNSQAG